MTFLKRLIKHIEDQNQSAENKFAVMENCIMLNVSSVNTKRNTWLVLSFVRQNNTKMYKLINYSTQIDFMINWGSTWKIGAQTTLLDLDWFYDILGLDLKNTWTNVLDSDWFYYNQAGMLLEKYKTYLNYLLSS